MRFEPSRFVAAVTALSFIAGCSPHIVPPPAAPAKIVPVVADDRGPPARGNGRVILDAEGEHARVVEVVGTAMGSVSGGRRSFDLDAVIVRSVCVTPCVTDLSYGTHELVFSSEIDPEKGSTVNVEVGGGTSVLRESMGYTHIHSGLLVGGGSLVTLGVLGVFTGTVLAAVGASHQDTGFNSDGTKRDSGMGTGPGFTVLGISATAVVAGIVLLVLGAQPETQQGSATQWRLPEPPTPPHLSPQPDVEP